MPRCLKVFSLLTPIQAQTFLLQSLGRQEPKYQWIDICSGAGRDLLCLRLTQPLPLDSDFVLESGNTNNHLSLCPWRFGRMNVEKVVNLAQKARGASKMFLTELCCGPFLWSVGIFQFGLTFLCTVLVNHEAAIKRGVLPGYSIYVGALLLL